MMPRHVAPLHPAMQATSSARRGDSQARTWLLSQVADFNGLLAADALTLTPGNAGVRYPFEGDPVQANHPWVMRRIGRRPLQDADRGGHEWGSRL